MYEVTCFTSRMQVNFTLWIIQPRAFIFFHDLDEQWFFSSPSPFLANISQFCQKLTKRSISYFSYWQSFDYPFGKTRETLGSIFYDLAKNSKLDRRIVDATAALNASRMGIYEVLETKGKIITSKELLTNVIFHSTCLTGYNGKPGDLMFARIVPSLSEPKGPSLADRLQKTHGILYYGIHQKISTFYIFSEKCMKRLLFASLGHLLSSLRIVNNSSLKFTHSGNGRRKDSASKAGPRRLGNLEGLPAEITKRITGQAGKWGQTADYADHAGHCHLWGTGGWETPGAPMA